jgi:hypothetical protein
MEIRKNFSLIVGVSIPILMILFVAGSIYLPGLFVKPKFNFLYATGDDYFNSGQYIVQGGKLVKKEIEESGKSYVFPGEIKLFIHDVSQNESREVSFEEAQDLDLDPNVKSPDGFEVVYGSRGEGFFPFLFGTRADYSTRYLKGHNVSKKLNVQLSGGYYNNFRFLGWIKN